MTDDTSYLQGLIDTAESGNGVCTIPAGSYSHTGLTFTKGIVIEGAGWNTILTNTSSTNHSICRTGSSGTDTQGFCLRDIKLTHSGSGSVDGIHLENMGNHLRFDRVWVENAPRHGFYIKGVDEANGAGLYSLIQQCWFDGAGTDGVFIDGASNSFTIVGGRIGSNTRYGINLDDTHVGGGGSYPNTITVIGTDLPGNDTGLHDNGSDNSYFGLRFESNDTIDIHLDEDCNRAMFFGCKGNPDPSVNDESASFPVFFDKQHRVRSFNQYGFAEYYDEADAKVRRLPKRGVRTVRIPAIAAADATSSIPGFRVEDNLKITRLSFIADAAVTGQNTNYRRLAFRVKDVSASTDTAIGVYSFTSGYNATALADQEVTILTGKDSWDQGDVLYIENAKYGSGLALPAFTLQIEFEGRN